MVRAASLTSLVPVALGLLVTGQTSAERRPVDLIAHHGNIITVDPQFRLAQAFAVRNGRFVRVGSDGEILPLRTSGTRIVDLQGKTVMPGFVDGHVHGGGRVQDVNLHPLKWPKTIDELVQRVREVASAAPAGQWLSFATDWHPSILQERRFPTRFELDEGAPRNPVFIIRGGQTAVVNSLALKLAGIARDTQPPEGVGHIEKDPQTGEPTGLLLANALFLVRKVMPPFRPDMETIVRSIVDKNALFNEAGITSVRDAGLTPDAIRAFQEVHRRGRLTVRTSMMYEPPSREEPLGEVIRQIRAFGPVTGIGDEWLRIDGLKLYVDGGMESAYLTEPFITDPTYRGLKNYTPEKLLAIVKEANRLGWTVGVHSVGDAAIEMALDAYEAANAEKSIVGRRWALEHPFLLVSERNIERAKRLGLIASAQSWHVYRYGYPMVTYWGKERANVALPFKSWLEKGVRVAGGSDAAPEPGMMGVQFLLIWAELTRNSEQSGVLAPQERITREQAIRLHTHAPTYLTFEENIKGTIEPGRLSDFIVLSDDILTVPEDQIRKLEVLATFVGGKELYVKPGVKLTTSADAARP